MTHFSGIFRSLPSILSRKLVFPASVRYPKVLCGNGLFDFDNYCRFLHSPVFQHERNILYNPLYFNGLKEICPVGTVGAIPIINSFDSASENRKPIKAKRSKPRNKRSPPGRRLSKGSPPSPPHERTPSQNGFLFPSGVSRSRRACPVETVER